MRRLLVLAFFTGTAVLCAVTGIVTASGDESEESAFVSQVASNTFPGGGGSIVSAPDGARDDLVFTLGSPAAEADAAAGSVGQLPADFVSAELSWRGFMASALVAQRFGLAGFRIVNPDGSTPALGTDDDYAGSFGASGPWAVRKKIGSVSIDAAEAQLNSNFKTLQAATGPTFDHFSVQRLVLSEDDNAFAFLVTIHSSLPTDRVRPYLGDLLVGMQTGLVGDESARVDGLALVLENEDGALAASFSAPRAGAGELLFGHELDAPGTLSTKIVFPNLTGGDRAPDIAVSGTPTSVDGS